MVQSQAGTLYIVGTGPGDPELMTLKAARVIGSARTIAYFAGCGRQSHARAVAAAHISPDAEDLRLEYPFTTECHVNDEKYIVGISEFYAECTARIAARLDAGIDVGLLCEGDPFFYGSSQALLDRLGTAYKTVVIPGVTGMSGCWTRAGTPMAHGDDVLTVLPGTLDENDLAARLAASDAAVIVKVGRNLPKIRAALRRSGHAGRAVYVERGTMTGERILPFAELDETAAPYFSLILVPGRQRRR
ncbi:MAG TPA: precorrin-2 C(20)-methyltransferase [Acetobacteraceae bacterium]|nr:precorrin-2 C(20)-methyltransferase [Acetobacteraceae bacterium]